MDLRKKCKIAKLMNKVSGFLAGLIGLGEIYLWLNKSDTILSELSLLLEGSRNFSSVSEETILFIFAAVIIIVSFSLFLLGKHLYWKWFCKEIERRYGTD